MTINVLIADDHPIVRDGLRHAIGRTGGEISVLEEASDGLEVLQIADRRDIEVFVLDITMPRLNGLDTARDLIRRDPESRIIILSVHNSKDCVEKAIEIGVKGYLTKETASRNIVQAIREVRLGRYFLSPDIAGFIVKKAVRDDKKTRSGAKPSLTIQERKVLQLIAEGRTTKEIAAELGLAVNTVLVHRKSLMSKLGIHKETDLVRFAIKEGIAKL